MHSLNESDADEDQGTVLVFMLNGGMRAKIGDAGGKFIGCSWRQKELDILLVIRAEFDGRAMVAFVGASSMALAVVETEAQLFSGGLKWKADKFARRTLRGA